jgi:hypothetical protein
MGIFVYLLSTGWLFLIGIVSIVAYTAIARPAWPFKLSRILGNKSIRGYDDPLYPFKRWTWKEPPENWLSVTTQCVLWMLVFGALALFFAFNMPEPKRWPIIAFPSLMSIHFLIHALRIYLRVKKIGAL